MAYRHVVRKPNLQARIFLPNFFVKIVRPGHEIPDNVVQMHIPLDMGKLDLRNYLEKIYNVKVEKVNTRIQRGSVRTILKNQKLVEKKPNYTKVAYVTLAEGTFKFPDLFPKAKASKPSEESEEPKPITTEKELEEKSKDHLETISKPWFQVS